MGDPLSVAGSAVGIISLGIQVCQGLVQYADAVRGQQRDADDGMDDVRSLLAVFKSLEQTIARIEIDSPENAKSLLEHLQQAEAKLQSLEEVLAEVGIPVNTPSSIKGKMKETYRAAIYPLKKSKLEGARRNVQSVLGILTTAMQTVDLDLGVSQSDALKALQASTTSSAGELKAAIEVNSTKLESLQATYRGDVSDVNKSLISARTEVQAFSTRSSSQLDSIGSDARESLENTQLIVRMIRDLSLQINATSTTSRGIGSHNQNVRFMATLGSRVPPSSLKQACDLYATDADLIPESSKGISELPQPRRRRSRGAYLEHTTVSEHDVGCPFAKFACQSSITKAGARFRLQLRNMFSALVDVSICLKTGAGGVSLSPSLRYVHIRDDKGPVLRLILDFFSTETSSFFGGQQESMLDRLRHMRRQITACFEQGIASPHDITTDFYGQSWMWLMNIVPTLYKLDRYEEEALGFALDTVQWLVDASSPEMAGDIAHDLQVKSSSTCRQTQVLTD
ncbi:hypothetical protein CDV31_012102 [Fusarium ambrosium]|uniref:Fungal N-terminal domain-containing protein n=1 Tax=Fusarium ambrosium TaxID=131363 RepID=A0A428TCA1_9HYPO|nr:hypothetical protein CDV31_012102 [Fusarium ambrosium]